MKKSNKIKRFIALLISIILCFGMFAGCGSCSNNDDDDQSSKKEFAQTQYNLVENGVSNYSIIVSQQPSELEIDAAELIQKYFEEATGFEILIKDEGQVKLTETSSLLIIGRTKLLEESEIVIDSDLGPCGFMIKRVDSNLFLCGTQDLGTLYSAQDFLHYHFNYEVYQASLNDAEKAYSLETSVRDKKLLDLNMTDSPDIPYRQKFGQYFGRSKEMAYALRMTESYDAFVLETPDRSNSWPWHNTLRVIDPKVYNDPNIPETYHPDWFVTQRIGAYDRTQINYTANGNQKELALLQDEVVKKLTYAIDKDFAKGKYPELISFMQEDNNAWVDGESMDYFVENYGTAAKAASLIYFINPVAKKIREYVDEKYPGREMYIVIFAYGGTLEAPVITTENGYEPMSENVKLEENVSVLYAPISADFTSTFHDEENARYLDIMNKWASLTDHLNFWIYSTYFHQQFMFFDNFNVIQDNLKILASYNPQWIFNESRQNKASTGFHAFKEYLISKLMWDVDANVEELTNNFFKYYFHDAADIMKELYYELRTYHAYLKDYKGLTGEIWSDGTDDRTLWPQKTVDFFSSYIDMAYEKIEPLKETNRLLYNTVYNRIKSEGLLFRFIKILNYENAWFTEEEYNAAIDELIMDCNNLGLNDYTTSQTAESKLLTLRK